MEKKFKFDKKLDEEVCLDIIKLRDKCVKAYKLTQEEKHEFYWKVMSSLANIIERKEKASEMGVNEYDTRTN